MKLVKHLEAVAAEVAEHQLEDGLMSRPKPRWPSRSKMLISDALNIIMPTWGSRTITAVTNVYRQGRPEVQMARENRILVDICTRTAGKN